MCVCVCVCCVFAVCAVCVRGCGVRHVQPVAMPLALAPCGFGGMMWRDGEIAAAQAAEEFGVPFTLSTMSINSIEDVAGMCCESVQMRAETCVCLCARARAHAHTHTHAHARARQGETRTHTRMTPAHQPQSHAPKYRMSVCLLVLYWPIDPHNPLFP